MILQGLSSYQAILRTRYLRLRNDNSEMTVQRESTLTQKPPFRCYLLPHKFEYTVVLHASIFRKGGPSLPLLRPEFSCEAEEVGT